MVLVEESLSNVARRVKEKLSEESDLSSPSHVVELEDIGEPHTPVQAIDMVEGSRYSRFF